MDHGSGLTGATPEHPGRGVPSRQQRGRRRPAGRNALPLFRSRWFDVLTLVAAALIATKALYSHVASPFAGKGERQIGGSSAQRPAGSEAEKKPETAE